MRTALITALVLLLTPAGSSHAHVRSSEGYADVRGEGGAVRYEVTRSRPPSIEPGTDWAQFHGDVQHSGIAADVLRDENDVKVGGVHAVDIESGRTLWRFEVPASVHGTPAVADGLVFVP